MKIAIDSNVLGYAAGVDTVARRALARSVLESLSLTHDLVAPIQVLGELFNILVRKGGLPRIAARDQVREWRSFVALAPTTEVSFHAGVDLAVAHNLKIWDALILSASAEAGCQILLSEDMQDGFTWRGVTVANPFAEPQSAALREALE